LTERATRRVPDIKVLVPEEPVPDADVQEQHLPPEPDVHRRTDDHLVRDEPEADVLEQDMPVDEPNQEALIPDDDRIDPFDDDEIERDEPEPF
jgi:hypothetical protein